MLVFIAFLMAAALPHEALAVDVGVRRVSTSVTAEGRANIGAALPYEALAVDVGVRRGATSVPAEERTNIAKDVEPPVHRVYGRSGRINERSAVAGDPKDDLDWYSHVGLFSFGPEKDVLNLEESTVKKPEPTSGEVESFQKLGAKFDGKTIVIAGDSLMWSVRYYLVHRIYDFGGTVTPLPGASMYWPSEAGDKLSRNLSAYELDQRIWKSVLGKGGFVQSTVRLNFKDSTSFVLKSLFYHPFPKLMSSEFFREASGGDLVLINLGHVAITVPNVADSPTEAFKLLASELVDKAATGNIPMVFVEHPPSHFYSTNGDYHNESDFRDHKCKCHPTDEMHNQYSYRCERLWLEPFARQHGLRTIRWFDSLLDKCEYHSQTDCRHYYPIWGAYKEFFSGLIAIDEASERMRT